MVHMWCDLDMDFRTASSSSPASEDWVVCKGVGFLFDKELPSVLQRFCARIKRDLLSVGPGLFNVNHGLDADRLPSVECAAHPNYRWLVWVNYDDNPAALHEWILWRVDDVRASRGIQPPLQAGPGKA